MGHLNVAMRLGLLLVVAATALIGVAALGLTMLRDARYDDRIQKVRSIVEVGQTLASSIHADAIGRGGVVETAIEGFRIAINDVRYENNEYLFAHTLDGVVLALPPRPDLIGADIYDITDPDGVFIMQELIAQAKSGEGVVRYM